MFPIYKLLSLLYICHHPSSSMSVKKSEKRIKSDIKNITIQDLASDYSGNPGKEIVLDGKNKEKALIYPKKNLFSKNFKMMDCSSKGCEKETLSEEEKIKFDNCNYEGYVVSDPDSKVSLSQCDRNNKDVSIVSDKVNFDHDSYRIDKDGNVDVPQLANFSDTIEESKYIEDQINEGLDYSDTSSDFGSPVFFDRNKTAIIVKDVSKGCCRPTRARCQLIKTENGEAKSCKVQLGKILCDTNKTQPKEVFQTCSQLKDYARRKSTQHKKIKIKKLPKKKIMKADMPDSEEKYSEEEYSEEVVTKKEKSKEIFKTKSIHEISEAELSKLVRHINAPKKQEKKNLKCKKKTSRFRSAIIISYSCDNPPCREKLPIPKQKIYSHRTIEIGVVIDKALYQQISKEIGSRDSKKVKKKIVEMVHAIFVDVENFLTHKSFTSLAGGFKLAINGIIIYKDDDDEYSRKWNSGKTLREMLKSFKAYAFKFNGACDADEDSYDAMILLTGRADQLQDEGLSVAGSAMGLAHTGSLCNLAPTLVMTVRTDGKGMHSQILGRLLSHELGHVIGSDHDGMTGLNPYGPYYRQDVPCSANTNLMSPSVGISMNTWSECTKKMVDEADKYRKKEGKDCLFT